MVIHLNGYNLLKQRSRHVVMDGKHSSWTDIDSVVPQGAVLGPLFLLQINDHTKSISSHVRLFTGDCLLYKVIK